MLANDVVSFEQLGPGHHIKAKNEDFFRSEDISNETQGC